MATPVQAAARTARRRLTAVTATWMRVKNVMPVTRTASQGRDAMSTVER